MFTLLPLSITYSKFSCYYMENHATLVLWTSGYSPKLDYSFKRVYQNCMKDYVAPWQKCDFSTTATIDKWPWCFKQRWTTHGYLFIHKYIQILGKINMHPGCHDSFAVQLLFQTPKKYLLTSSVLTYLVSEEMVSLTQDILLNDIDCSSNFQPVNVSSLGGTSSSSRISSWCSIHHTIPIVYTNTEPLASNKAESFQ